MACYASTYLSHVTADLSMVLYTVEEFEKFCLITHFAFIWMPIIGVKMKVVAMRCHIRLIVAL